MINLRYHIVSITAVFLALGIGIAMGSSFLSDAAVEQVDRNIESTRNEARSARAEAGRLRDEVERRTERDEELRDQAAARLFRADLAGVPVVVLTVGGVDEDSLDRLRTALTSSQADFAGTLTITDGVAATGDDANTVARLLDREDASEAALRSGLAVGVARELLAAAGAAEDQEDEGGSTTTGPGTTTTDVPGSTVPGTEPDPTTTTTPPDEAPTPELIRALVDEGILDYEPAPGGEPIETALEAPGHRYVIVSGADADVADGLFFRPLLRAMTDDQPAPVVVASAAVGDEAEVDRTVAIAPLLVDEVVAARITTVDDLESLGGLAAVVLGLDDLGRDRRGHYGIGPGAESQLPQP
ncbi:MAG TPA: copper transporter [Acidimicrobiales bacterium]|nr:copper transporter [Acidimicrobiales bacterium]